jgi:UDP-3-O-[3-hydroxymyristoyl] glucosamine N-acyltransferase
MKRMTVRQLADKLGARIDGNGDVEITGVATIGEAGPGDISFVANPRYIGEIDSCGASALIVADNLETDFRPLLRTSNPYLAFATAVNLIVGEGRPPKPGIHPSVVMGADVTIGSNVAVMANTIIEDGASIDDNTIVYSGCYLGRGTAIGKDCRIYHRVIIGSGSQLHDRVIIHSGTVLGSNPVDNVAGNGAASGGGAIILEDEVELGANVTIESAPGQTTLISAGAKMDNMVFVEGGVRIGKNAIIVSQVGLGSGCEIGESATIAGKAQVAPGVKVGARSTLGGRSFATEDIPDDCVCSGSPARPHLEARRLKVYLSRLPDFSDRLKILEEKLRR